MLAALAAVLVGGLLIPREEGVVLGAGDAVVLGLVEGITEYLPVSSTGHLTVTQRLLGVGDAPDEKAAADAYAIVIQAGAILAVLLLYHRRVRSMAAGLVRRDADGQRLAVALTVAFIPAALIGVALGDTIKERLFGVGPVAGAWIAGGVAILLLAPRWQRPHGRPLEAVTARDALIVGLAQALALWPGVSRSLVTILGALALGLSIGAAVEFSFLLGMATLGAATGYEAVRSGSEIVDRFGVGAPLIGFAVALVSAALAVRWLVEYLTTRTLGGFGWYRLAAGTAAFALLAAGVL
jgi:undecaprenyl-diphosphatase